ncbi:Cobalt-zinc-cadmium resistance protein CzcD [Caballeronia glathei]|jgi:Co/Zn/Cd efflux system component|uniref:Cation transporter n=1 Tax=Caballeronia glathei TaxID=60547 RepID=A0A069PII9_9BURK|nr:MULTISPECIES: cation transporter [Burkholderiaceae]KDR39724.1 cation transporter [Caballeronia glathei]TCK39461.1 Co/Zn/Cd efflux system component [Paraburkholderia sp. BL8N3]CDY74764.1 Cobalt-zinc-cadmium resistance protein CzcD [Caballeronia glathei]
MQDDCCSQDHGQAPRHDSRYRSALWIALAVNFAMFVVEVVSGIVAGSVSLLADSVDFIGDAANYGISLFVLGMGLAARARASLLKAFSMAAFGIGVLGCALWHAFDSTTPSAPTMGAVGTLALAANCGVALLLYAHRDGDSNRRSVWLCTRNDALGNLAVLVAALGVFGTSSAWPDLSVAGIMAALALGSSARVLRQARAELRETAVPLARPPGAGRR